MPQSEINTNNKNERCLILTSPLKIGLFQTAKITPKVLFRRDEALNAEKADIEAALRTLMPLRKFTVSFKEIFIEGSSTKDHYVSEWQIRTSPEGLEEFKNKVVVPPTVEEPSLLLVNGEKGELERFLEGRIDFGHPYIPYIPSTTAFPVLRTYQQHPASSTETSKTSQCFEPQKQPKGESPTDSQKIYQFLQQGGTAALKRRLEAERNPGAASALKRFLTTPAPSPSSIASGATNPHADAKLSAASPASFFIDPGMVPYKLSPTTSSGASTNLSSKSEGDGSLCDDSNLKNQLAYDQKSVLV